MGTDQLTYSGTLVLRRCWCGIRHAIPSELDYMITNEGHSGYCPLGHSYVHRGKTDEQKQKERADRLAARLTSTQDQLEAAERSKSALKGVVTRTKRRIGNGVCPVQGCKRHFKNVDAHITRMHPDYHEDAQS